MAHILKTNGILEKRSNLEGSNVKKIFAGTSLGFLPLALSILVVVVGVSSSNAGTPNRPQLFGQTGSGLKALGQPGSGFQALGQTGSGLKALGQTGSGFQTLGQTGSGFQALGQTGSGF